MNYQIDYKPQSDRLLTKVRVLGAKKDQDRRVLLVREGLVFLQQRRNRAFVSSLINYDVSSLFVAT